MTRTSLYRTAGAAPLLALISAAGLAQEAGPPLAIGSLQTNGFVTFGYRFTDVNGYYPKFQELFNLRGGLRMQDFSLYGDDPTHANKYLDHFSAVASGLGGDPFTSAQLNVRKTRVYDLRVDWRQSQYYWNRNDGAALPTGLNGLTGNHDWATVRKLGTVNLLVHASNNLRFNFEYYKNSRDGINYTTRSLTYFGAPSDWNGFARANPYLVLAPLSENSNRATAGVDYTRGGWAVHYKLGYQRFESAINGNEKDSPERSINIDDANTATELASGIRWIDNRKLTTPVSEFSYTGNIRSRWKARGGYLFYRFQGPASLDLAYDGIARTSDTSIKAPYSVSMSSRAVVTEPNHVVDQGFTFQATNWWSILADYRYNRFSVDATGDFRSVRDVGIVSTGQTITNWQVGTHTGDLSMQFTPATHLLVRAGIRLMKSDVAYTQDGITDPERTKRINTVWPVGSVFWEPSKMLTIRADADSMTNGASYTRITPHIQRGFRATIRFRPTAKFYLEDAMNFRKGILIDTDYRNTIRTNAVTLHYEFNDKLSVLAGFSYDSYFASNFVSFLRGTAPIYDLTLRDQTVSRVWQGGLRAGPWKNAGFQFTGNFVRTTGMGEIAGELPLYGPMTFPYAAADIYYDLHRAGRFALQVQRAYYNEQIVPANNFSTNMLMISWTHSLTQLK